MCYCHCCIFAVPCALSDDAHCCLPKHIVPNHNTACSNLKPREPSSTKNSLSRPSHRQTATHCVWLWAETPPSSSLPGKIHHRERRAIPCPPIHKNDASLRSMSAHVCPTMRCFWSQRRSVLLVRLQQGGDGMCGTPPQPRHCLDSNLIYNADRENG